MVVLSKKTLPIPPPLKTTQCPTSEEVARQNFIIILSKKIYKVNERAAMLELDPFPLQAAYWKHPTTYWKAHTYSQGDETLTS
jgi:hypothetical protein